ncbi:type VI secretion system-associated FHA domain protein TagH [Thiocystis violacea]|uniref:type VI secretion system-associated FHA domain protein TagH n=1 Tax=Thiocystis violacea TaxID=13725 RepID=UPI001907C3D6|nr:type VI secretion system-associated FHA domain protein TagH [Thiocystis violacea]MBK1721547.1 hypothetical protein [Thiocystis violacea]
MELNLRVTNRQGQTSPREVTLSLAQGGITIGRGLGNDLCLEDPERVISGSHARIEARDGGVWITDSSRNGTYLNHAADPIPSHQSVALYDGDRLGIGPYDVVVGFGDESAFNDDEIADPFSEIDAADLADLAPSGPAADILDLLGPGGGHGGGDLLPDLPPESQSTDRRLPEDPFGDASALDEGLAGPAQEAPPRGAPHHHTPVERVFYRPAEHQAAPENYDLLNDAWIGVERDSEAAGAPAVRQASSESESESEPNAGLAPEVALPDTERTDMIPELQEAAPVAAAPPRRPEPPRPKPYPSGSATGGELGAFLAGLGVGQGAQVQDPEAFMRLSGELLRALATGLVQTMMGRAQFKSELRLGVTSIRAAQNNPFKFSVDTSDILDRLLFRPNPGYLPAVAAAREAFEDVQAHEMAMTAGLQAALRALFARFEPSRLEERLGRASGLDQVLPMARKAKYWDLFNQEYGKVAADASEDFMQLFDDAFARAYLEQIERLRAARGGARG